MFEYHDWKRGGFTEHANNRLHVMDDQKRIALLRRGDPHPDDRKPAVKQADGRAGDLRIPAPVSPASAGCWKDPDLWR